MTNPKYAQATDKGRYYVLPTGEKYPSVTNILDTCVSKPVLVPWAAKITAEEFWDRIPAAVRASLRGEAAKAEFLKMIKGRVRVVKDTAADLGTRVHDYADAKVKGTPHPYDDEVEPFAVQLLRFFTDFGVNIDKDIEAAEATIVNRTHGYAGTGDLWAWLRLAPDGTWWPRKRFLWLIDYKTSSTRDEKSTYPENGLQLAAIANGETVLLADGTEEKPPGPIAATAVLNLRVRTYGFIPLAPDRAAAFAGFVGLLAGTRYLHSISGKPALVRPPAPTPHLEKEGAA